MARMCSAVAREAASRAAAASDLNRRRLVAPARRGAGRGRTVREARGIGSVGFVGQNDINVGQIQLQCLSMRRADAKPLRVNSSCSFRSERMVSDLKGKVVLI